jgi:CDP-paratose 2-epimerase
MSGRVLITGGAGFIGSNLAHCLLASGREVLIFDNLSRPGVQSNFEWLRSEHAQRLKFELGDVRDRFALRAALRGVSEVYHLAAQVAVTSSLADPAADFEINARGTLNLLEQMRACAHPPLLIFTSTNKVYGDLSAVELVRGTLRYEPLNRAIRRGVSERRRLSFHSPYGCSKGAADQYVLDYARVFGLRAVVFRMSCIYGPRQFGTEDQGWVAHFLIRALAGHPIVIYGDGYQVRDILYIDDLLSAFMAARENIEAISGRAFNIGGGPANTVSLLELAGIISELQGTPPRLCFEPWRPADQRYYVSDTRAFSSATGWKPSTGVRAGIRRLHSWLSQSRPESFTASLKSRLAS